MEARRRVLNRHPCLSGCLLLLCVLCGGFTWMLEDHDRVISTPINKWRAKRALNSTYRDILKITHDEKLAEIQAPKVTVGGTVRCISAEAVQVLGTDRTFSEVVNDYYSWLKKREWKLDGIYGQGLSLAHVYRSVDGSFYRRFGIERYQLEEPVDFKTVYRVDVQYWETRCMD